jgi:hypothetical protein
LDSSLGLKVISFNCSRVPAEKWYLQFNLRISPSIAPRAGNAAAMRFDEILTAIKEPGSSVSVQSQVGWLENYETFYEYEVNHS